MRWIVGSVVVGALLAPAWAGDDEGPTVELKPGEGPVAWTLSSNERFDGGLAASPDGARVAAVADDWVFILKAATGAEERRWELKRGRCNALAWAPDGRRLAIATRNGVRCVDADTGAELWRGTAHPDRVPKGYEDRYPQPEFGIADAVAWNGDGSRVATVSREVTNVRLLDGATGAKVQEVELGFEEIRCLVSTPDGSLLIALAEDGPIAAINWPDASVRWTHRGDHEPALAVSADSRHLACGWGGGSAGVIRIRNTTDGAVAASFAPIGDFDIGGVALNADGTAFVASGAGKGLSPLVYWKLSDGNQPTTVWERNYPVEGIVRAGNLVVVAGKRADELRAYRLP